MPPQLPPRSPSQASSMSSLDGNTSLPRQNTIHLTPQTFSNHPYANHGGLDDPRSSSTQSLRPIESAGPSRRTLLVIYIHGFMGDVTSFQSFPAHVHSLLTMTLAESHVVHTKLYPRYQSRKNISFARDAFGNWLAPHESDTTDVVLIGHSLGGILGAEVVLLPSHTPGSRDAFQHRILGLIAFDTPFLGMHPGVISTGIASLFRGSPDQADEGSTSPVVQESTSWQPLETVSSDPNFNPAFTNDVNLPVRTNKWERAWYFMNKHYGELRKATQSYVKSHLEFGGCLADYPGLRKRYDAVRSLEDVDDLQERKDQNGRYVHRVRFVNYYTASTGRIKEQKPPTKDGYLTTETEMQTLKSSSSDQLSAHSSRSITPRLSLEEHREDGIVNKTNELEIDDHSSIETPMTKLEPQPHDKMSDEEANQDSAIEDEIPSLPSIPTPPETLDTTLYTDPNALHAAQKEYMSQMKSYEKAMKDFEKAISNREKAIAKRNRQKAKEEAKAEKLAKKEEERLYKEKLKRQSTLNPEEQDKQIRAEAKAHPSSSNKPKKDRKFCSLPSKDSNGRRDPTWIRVYMEGMDEVVAHTSLFFVSDAYAKLVGDVAERIEEWVGHDATMRAVRLEQR